MTVANVGANIGYHTLLFAHNVGSRGRVVSFEPDPVNLGELHTNCDANNLDHVSVVEAAVGNEKGKVGFRSGLNGNIDTSSGHSVPITTIDATFSDRPVDFIKVDVEGFEMSVLEGAKDVISRDMPIIFLEMHSKLSTNHSRKNVLKFINSFYNDVRIYQKDEKLTSKIMHRYLGGHF